MKSFLFSLQALAAITLGAGAVLAADKPEPKKKPAWRPVFLNDTPEQFLKRFDRNKDGFVTKDEVPPWLAKIFARFDTDKDGKLDRKEIAGLLQVMRRRFGAAQGPNPRQVERLVNNILRRMDTDKDGRISRKEARNRVAKFFTMFDTNKDGYLDREELRNMVRRFLANRRGGQGGPGAQGPDFDALDKNADGRLTREELKGTRFAAVFDEIDTNKDGKIDRKEFEAYLKKMTGKKE
jgi:Ca2+-binding EF-hand superfamily protein